MLTSAYWVDKEHFDHLLAPLWVREGVGLFVWMVGTKENSLLYFESGSNYSRSKGEII